MCNAVFPALSFMLMSTSDCAKISTTLSWPGQIIPLKISFIFIFASQFRSLITIFYSNKQRQRSIRIGNWSIHTIFEEKFNDFRLSWWNKFSFWDIKKKSGLEVDLKFVLWHKSISESINAEFLRWSTQCFKYSKIFWRRTNQSHLFGQQAK